MEIRTCEEYVLAKLEETEEELEFSKSAYKGSILHVKELEMENKALTKQLERAAEQMAELEEQMTIMANKYNELARQGVCFEPVKEGNDGNYTE